MFPCLAFIFTHMQIAESCYGQDGRKISKCVAIKKKVAIFYYLNLNSNY